MSKTDKTDPYWVKIDRREGNRLPWREYHDHHGKQFNGVCTVAARLPKPRDGGEWWHNPCSIWPRYRDYKFWPRRPKRKARKAIGFEGKNRGELLRLRRLWRLEPIREDIDSSWGAPRRRCQVRDPWNWD